MMTKIMDLASEFDNIDNDFRAIDVSLKTRKSIKVKTENIYMMIQIYPRNSLVIHKADNGFILNRKGTVEDQEDGLDGVFVFGRIEELTNWLIIHFQDKSE